VPQPGQGRRHTFPISNKKNIILSRPRHESHSFYVLKKAEDDES